ncbi:MAG: phosphopantothenoylcysteine decarboxylase, partial [Candidatus Poseidoniia archaeon]|nr:phosphopantothenoylcysteine decarboxylase [Candidatus Poseidoniia archaeon]
LRHGAEVRIVASAAALEIVGPKALEFACGRPPVTEITGQVEHVTADADLLVIAPCTASSLAKVVHGIGDTPPTLFALTLLGSGVPLLIAPAMDGKMAQSSVVQENLSSAREIATVLDPVLEEGKAKLPTRETVTAWACHLAGKRDFADHRMLIIGGGTAEPLDDVRVLGNRSSGRMAVALAEVAFARGADVALWLGSATVAPGNWIPLERFTTLQELAGRVESLGAWDAILLPAALADFRPTRQPGKIASGQRISLELEPAPKLLPLLRRAHSGKLVAFKLADAVSDEELIKKADTPLEYADLVVANTTEAMEAEAARVVLVSRKGIKKASGNKRALAGVILDRLQLV